MMTALALRRPWHIVERNVKTYRRYWPAFVSGFLEPLLYLFAIGIGVGALAGDVTGPGGEPIEYRQFIAPAMLAVTAMNGVLFDATFNFFFKFKYAKTFDAILATPLQVRDLIRGEMMWSLVRAAIYATIFLATMLVFGLVGSWWAVLSVPASLLIGFAFAGAGYAATTFMRSFVDFDYVNALMIPMFLFSATFFPLAEYPGPVQAIVQVTPLYQGVAIQRALVLGEMGPGLLVNVAYLLVMGAVGLRIANRRMRRLLQP